MWISTQVAKEQLAQPLSCIPLSEVLDQNVYIVKPIQCGRVRGAVEDPKCGRRKATNVRLEHWNVRPDRRRDALDAGICRLA